MRYISDVLMGKFPTLNDDLKTAQEEVQRLCLLLSVAEAKSRAKDETIQHLKDLKPRQFEMVARELMRTAIFAYRTRPMPEADALSVAERSPGRGKGAPWLPGLPRPDKGL